MFTHVSQNTNHVEITNEIICITTTTAALHPRNTVYFITILTSYKLYIHKEQLCYMTYTNVCACKI